MSINILYIGIGPYTGGPIISLIHLIEHLDKDKFTPYVFSLPNPHLNTINRLNDIENIHIVEKNIWINNWLKSSNSNEKHTIWHYIKSPGRWARLIYNSWQISKIIKDNDIQLVHTNIELVLEGAIAAWFAQIPHVWHIRAPLGRNGVVNHFLGERFCCSVISFLSKQVIVNSNATKDSVSKYIHNKKINMIYNGINPLEYNLPKLNNRLRQLLDIPNKKIIASIGYLSVIKGGREFVKIALEVCKSDNDVVFVWIGPYNKNNDDKFRKEIFELVEMNNMADRIFFTDERNDINMLLSDVDILLQPMVNGSWSRVVLEAMAAQIPVVAIEKNLISEFIIDEETGILARDENEAVEKIKILLSQKDKINLLCENALKRVSSDFTNNITSERIMGVYNEIIPRN